MGQKAKGAVSALSDALTQDRDHGVRQLAAVALGYIGHKTQKAMAALKKAVTDRIIPVKTRAAMTMYKLDPSTRSLVLRTVIPIARHKWTSARIIAVTALEKIGGPKAIIQLKRMLSDSDPFIVGQATDALKKLQKSRTP